MSCKDIGTAALISIYWFICSPGRQTTTAMRFSHHHYITYITQMVPGFYTSKSLSMQTTSKAIEENISSEIAHFLLRSQAEECIKVGSKIEADVTNTAPVSVFVCVPMCTFLNKII